MQKMIRWYGKRIGQYNGYQRWLGSMVYKVLEKKSRDNSAHTGAAIISEDQQLPNELHKPITRKFQETKSILVL